MALELGSKELQTLALEGAVKLPGRLTPEIVEQLERAFWSSAVPLTNEFASRSGESIRNGLRPQILMESDAWPLVQPVLNQLFGGQDFRPVISSLTRWGEGIPGSETGLASHIDHLAELVDKTADYPLFDVDLVILLSDQPTADLAGFRYIPESHMGFFRFFSRFLFDPQAASLDLSEQEKLGGVASLFFEHVLNSQADIGSEVAFSGVAGEMMLINAKVKHRVVAPKHSEVAKRMHFLLASERRPVGLREKLHPWTSAIGLHRFFR